MLTTSAKGGLNPSWRDANLSLTWDHSLTPYLLWCCRLKKSMPDCTLVYHDIHVPLCTFKSVKYALMLLFKSLVPWTERIKHPQENFIKHYYLRITNSKQGGFSLKEATDCTIIQPFPIQHYYFAHSRCKLNVFSGIPDSQTNQGKKYWLNHENGEFD